MSHAGHSHGSRGGGGEAAASPRVRWLLAAVLVPVAVLTLAGLVVLRGHGEAKVRTDVYGVAAERVDAEVVSLGRQACAPAAAGQDEAGQPTCPMALVKVSGAGPFAGRQTALVPEGAGAPRFHPGDRVVLARHPSAPPGHQLEVVDYQRDRPLALLALLFAAVVVVSGRWRGLAALAGLAVSAAVILWFVLPAILDGQNPLLVAITGSSAIMLVALFLTHGFTARTAVALLGTMGSLALTGLLSWWFVAVSHFTGLASEEAAFLRTIQGDLDVRGLLLAGVIIGSLGVLDDVTVTQTATVWEVAHANPGLPASQVYRAGARVGREHVASTVNTLVLAYAGAALPLLLLFSIASAPTGQVLASEVVAQEVVRALVGGIGIVAAVPVTTALATYVAVTDRGAGRSRRRPRAASAGRRRARVA